MEITYEQAIRLKDAGFPQPGDREEHSTDPKFQNGVYMPSLYEILAEVTVGGYPPKGETSDLNTLVELYISQKHNKN